MVVWFNWKITPFSTYTCQRNNEIPYSNCHTISSTEYPNTTTNFPVHLWTALEVNLQHKKIQPAFTITSLDLSNCIVRSSSVIPNPVYPNTNLVIFLSCRNTHSSTILRNDISTITIKHLIRHEVSISRSVSSSHIYDLVCFTEWNVVH